MIKKINILLLILVFLISACNAASTNLSVDPDPGNKDLGIEPSVHGFLTVNCNEDYSQEPLPKIWVKTADNKTPKFKVIWLDKDYINNKIRWEFKIIGLHPQQVYRIHGKTSISPTVVKTVEIPAE